MTTTRLTSKSIPLAEQGAKKQDFSNGWQVCFFVTTQTTPHTHAHTALSPSFPRQTGCGYFPQAAQPQKVGAEYLLLQGLTQRALRLGFNPFHSATLLQSYRGAEELQLPHTQ